MYEMSTIVTELIEGFVFINLLDCLPVQYILNEEIYNRTYNHKNKFCIVLALVSSLLDGKV